MLYRMTQIYQALFARLFIDGSALMLLLDNLFIQDMDAANHEQAHILHNIISQFLVGDGLSGNIQAKILPLDASAIGKFYCPFPDY